MQPFEPRAPAPAPAAIPARRGPAPGSRLTVLAGPSGVGKGTVVAALTHRAPSVWVSVSVTTRKPRPGEIDGVSYHFVDDTEFDAMIEAGELLEHSAHFSARYGTPRRPVEERLAAGEPVLVEIDINGARQVRAAMPDALFVFLAPPSWEELERRLVGRGTESEQAKRDRLERARLELATESEFDAVVVNESVGHACDELLTLMGLRA